MGNDPSQILGKLSANGQVILLNPNGIVFGKDGSVTASAFTASTFALSDADFMSGFYKYTRNGSTAAVVNQGTIETSAGGFVALIGATVTNEGTIHAPQGDVVMAAAETVTLTPEFVKPQPVTTPNTVSARMSKRVRLELDPAAINTAVNNTSTGVILTEGGQVLLQAAALSTAVASVTHSGRIDTSAPQAGAVTLLAEGGIIKATGDITANSSHGTAGGDIIIGRDEFTGELAKSTDVSGAKLESNKGFIETSGHDLKVDDIQVKAANWLLDPDNIDITGDATSATAGYSKIKASDIATAINAGTNVTVATTSASQVNQPAYVGAAVTGDGNIVVNAAIVKSGSSHASLTLLADNGITVNQRIGKASGDTTSTGTLNVTMTSGGVASVTGTSLGLMLNNVIDANGGTVNLTGTTSNATQNGVRFANGSGINAATYTVTGTNTSTTGGSAGSAQASGVMFNGTTSLTSTTGASTVTGDTRNTNGFGVMFYPGSSTLDAGAGSLAVQTASTSVAGIRSGWGGSSTINTKGNVTIGSKNNNKSDLMIQGVINAQSGSLTLLGKSNSTHGIHLWDGGGQQPKILATNAASITMNGESSTAAGAFGVMLGVANTAVISSVSGAISITGSSSTSTGVYAQNNSTISSSAGGNITLTGLATGASNGGIGLNLTNGSVTTTGQVQLNGTSTTNVAVINNATVTGAGVAVTGTASGNGGGISSSGTITATAGNVTLNGTSNGANSGVYSSAAITSNTGDVNITGTSVTGGGVTLQGSVTAQNNVTINGTSSSTSSAAQGVVIQNAVKANTGDITVTGNTNSNVQRAVALTVNGAVNGSLQTLAAGRNININADTLYVHTSTSVNATSTGTVNIKTTNGNRIELGSGDTMNSTAASRVLGLDQGELNRITAGKLVIGSATGGDIKVANVITTQDATGDLTLRTGGNVNIANNLTVGATGGKNLTIEAAGASSTVDGSGVVKANALKITGANASVAMASVAHQVSTLSADVKALAFKNSQALKVAAKTNDGSIQVETTNGTLTVDNLDGLTGLAAKGDITAVGNTTSGSGLLLGSSVKSDEGDVTLQGTTAGTAALNAGISVSAPGVEVSGKNVKVEGKATATTSNPTLGFRGAAGKFTATQKLQLIGSTQGAGSGVYAYGDEFNAGTGISINGASAKGHGVKFDQAGSGGSLVKLTNTSSGGISITGKTDEVADTSKTAITLNGTNMTNSGGEIKLTADKGKVDTTSQFGGSNTITQNANANVTITTKGNGDIVVPKIIKNGTGVGGIVIAAGSDLPAGDRTGGQVKTVSGNTITNAGTDKTLIYTGNPDDTGTGNLANLMGSLATLYLSQVGGTAQNAQLNTAYANSTTAPLNSITNGAQAQVMFRENTKFDEVQINPTTLTKTAGQTDPTYAAFAAAMASANPNGATLTKTSVTVNKFKIGTDAAGITGTLPSPSDQARTVGTYDYAVTSTSGIATRVVSTSNSKLVVQPNNIIPVPAPVVPSTTPTRIKVPVGAANPFALASVEDLATDVCSADSLENCHCEESSVNQGVNICYEPNGGSK